MLNQQHGTAVRQPARYNPDRDGSNSSISMRDRPVLPLYESHPPEWLPKAHVAADLGDSTAPELVQPILMRLQATLDSILRGQGRMRMS